MMAVELSKTKLVSARELSKVVDEAVKAAGAGGAGGGGGVGAGGAAAHNVIINPDILGRVIRDLAQAQHFADAVAKGVNKAGIAAEPVVLSVGKGINIAGFIEREALHLREF
jgi:hypothetical protein